MSARQAPDADAERVVDPTELVSLTPGTAAADRLAVFAADKGYGVERRDRLADLGLVMMTLRLPEGVPPNEAIDALEAREPEATVGLNHAYGAAPDFGAPGEARTYAETLLAWPEAGCPARVSVGVIDTPLDAGAPALVRAALTTRDFTDANVGVDRSHGTAVAELLAGPGRLRNARLFHAAVVSDVPGADPAAGVDDIMRAIDWLHASGVRVVNVSLAGPYNKILDRGLRAAAARGMVVVAAAGNDGPQSLPRYPAAFDYTIAVTAVDADLQAYDRAPRGNYIDVAAPGVDVFVPLGGDGRYMTGTSISTPFVTALIAADPATADIGSVNDVRTNLARGARDLGAAGRDDVFGAGLANATGPCRQQSDGL